MHNSRFYSGLSLNCCIIKKQALRIFETSGTIYRVEYFGRLGSFTLNVIYCAPSHYRVLRHSSRRRTGSNDAGVVFVGDEFINFQFLLRYALGKNIFLKNICHWDLRFLHYLLTFVR